jgi:hypothetical protein
MLEHPDRYPESTTRSVVVEREPIRRSSSDSRLDRTEPMVSEAYDAEHVAPDSSIWAQTGHWRTTLAGSLTACTVLLLMGLLGLAVALSQFNAGTAATEGALPAAFGRNVGFWILFSLLTSFVIGGYVASRAERVRVVEHAAWHGAQVFLLASPLLVLLLMGGLLAEASAVTSVISGLHVDPTVQARVNPSAVGDAAGHLRDMTWLTLIGALFGLIGSAAGGMLGSPRVMPVRAHHDRVRSR